MKGNTKATSPEQYIGGLEEPRRGDLERLHRLITATAPELPVVMVHGMIGYGPYHYKYESGREGDTAKICLASQKNYISLYGLRGDEAESTTRLYRGKVPKDDTGKGCIRFKRLDDLDEEVLKELVRSSAA